MSESETMAAHRRLVELINTDPPCADDDCDRQLLARALLAVSWRHCPVEWFNMVMSCHTESRTNVVLATGPEGTCNRCGVPYPCPDLEAVMDELEIPEPPCCADAGELSSHYHCGRCHGRTGMMGHYTERHGQEKVEGHVCCPGDCELKEIKE